MNQANMPTRKKHKQEGAASRAAAIADMTPQQRLAALDAKLGKDQGAKKERARMLAQIEAAARKPKPKFVGVVEDEPETKPAKEKKTKRHSKNN